MARYVQIHWTDLPQSGLRFDIPGRNQGQIVEVAYGGPDMVRSEYDVGAPYKRITDASIGVGNPERTSYWRLAREGHHHA